MEKSQLEGQVVLLDLIKTEQPRPWRQQAS